MTHHTLRMQQLTLDFPAPTPGKDLKTFADLFCGIGGFRIAAERNGMRCVFSSEIDKRARQVYKDNFGEYPSGDIYDISSEDIPDFDVLFAGFPCQPFSTAATGHFKGLEDKRGVLYLQISRVLRDKQPAVFLLENVYNLVHMYNGTVFSTIKNDLEQCGYDVSWKTINALQYVPQIRRRVYIVGFRKDLNLPHWSGVFHTSGKKPSLKEILDEPAEDWLFRKREKIDKIYENWKKGKDFSITIHDIDKGFVSALLANSGRTLLRYPDGRVRNFSVPEMKRLMGFPEDFRIEDKRNASNKLLGNSVVVPLVQDLVQNTLSVVGQR